MFQGANLVRLMLEIALEIKAVSALPVEGEQVRVLKQENHKSGLKGWRPGKENPWRQANLALEAKLYLLTLPPKFCPLLVKKQPNYYHRLT